MKVFQDVFTNDEILSDIFPHTLDYNDVIMKVRTQYKKKDDVGKVDIGCGNAFGGDEEDCAPGEVAEEKVIDVAFNSNLVQTQLSKPDFMTYIKAFLKNLKAYLEENGKKDRVEAFQKGAQDFVKYVVSKFNDFEFYTGSSESLEGSIVFSFWEDDTASGPVFYYFRDSLKEVKC